MTKSVLFNIINRENITEAGRAAVRDEICSEQANAAYWHRRSMIGSVNMIVYCQDRSASHAAMARLLMGIE